MNTVNLTGRAAKDFELRYTQSGKAVANGTIAVQRNFKNGQGEYEADFVDLVAWGKTGELMSEYIKKGDPFGIVGRLQNRIWEKDDGSKQKVTEVNVSEFDFPVKPKGNQQVAKADAEPKNPFSDDGQPIDISDLDLPF